LPEHLVIMKNIILFGKPGAGKGTQALLLREAFGFVHISTGDLFRHNIGNNTALGVLAKSYMDKGDLVPDEVTIQMLEAEVDANPEAGGFIFDGFPRTTKQALALDTFLEGKSMQIHATIALEVDETALVQRLLQRGEDSGRPDDQDEQKIRNRFAEYNKKTAPLIDYYKAQNKFHSIYGEGSIEEISAQLVSKLNTI
jgi:adenylate kinase